MNETFIDYYVNNDANDQWFIGRSEGCRGLAYLHPNGVWRDSPLFGGYYPSQEAAEARLADYLGSQFP